ncbi:MAG: hypothetical protein WCP39_05475, partial [Chlamydiota bacterium]
MFRKALLLFLFVESLFAIEDNPEETLSSSNPEYVSSLSYDNLLIGGVLSPSSGQICLKEIDLIANGAQSIELFRYYIPPSIPSTSFHKKSEQNNELFYSYLKTSYKGWTYFPHLQLIATRHSDRFEILLRDPQGITLAFQVVDQTAKLAEPFFGISNAQQETPSGQYDPRNIKITLKDSKEIIVVQTPDGYTRYYHLKRTSKTTSNPVLRMLYRLQKEVLPNGKILRYSYNNNLQLTLVESLDPQERFVYASIRMETIPTSLSGAYQYISNTEQTVIPTFERRLKRGKYTEHKVHYGYAIVAPPILTKVDSPLYHSESSDYDDRFLLEKFNGKSHVFSCQYDSYNNPFFRVKTLSLPVGKDDAFFPLYEMTYTLPIGGQNEGSTQVRCKDGTAIHYLFTKNFLIQSIQYFDTEKTLKKEKRFSWNDNNQLESVELWDGNKRIYKKAFSYDAFGNPTQELFIGNLTGSGKEESSLTKKTFSQDGRNLLLTEEKEGKLTSYSYLSKAYLITAKIIQNKEKILLREFFEYDDCNNLVTTITDDGITSDKMNLSGVTERRLSRRILRQSTPFLHMVDTIEERVLDKKEEKLITKTHFSYDTQGNVSQEDIYDENGDLSHTLHKTYDERGNLLSETNPIEQKALYRYDEKGRCIFSTSFSQRQETSKTYDTKGREKERIEKGDQLSHKTTFEYDITDNLIQKTDFFGNVTSYTYDPVVQKVNHTQYPPIESKDGSLAITTSSTYAAIGWETSKTDGNGHTTFYTYNAYGSPVEIQFPDSSRETFRYYTNGNLQIHTNRDGLSIHSTYDTLDRILMKKYIFQNRTLSEERFTYNSFHKLTETNKEGTVTTYVYDKKGKKISETFGKKKILFGYDFLGRVSSICKNNSYWIYYIKDLLDRIIEERKEDSMGILQTKTNFTFDEDGNQKTITRNSDTETFLHDAFGRLIEHRDPLGNVTKTIYDENYLNILGQKVLQITTIDPMNISTIQTENALGWTVKKEIQNPQKETIASEEFSCDPCNNVVLHTNHIYESATYLRTLLTKYSYTPMNYKMSMIRACGTPEEKIYQYTYTFSGRILTKTLPNGVVLTYTYTPFGYIDTLRSSDGKIFHVFNYTSMGYLLKAMDMGQNIVIERALDLYGNVVKENTNKLTIKASYDLFDRPLIITLPDDSKIRYTYDSQFLRQVDRFSSSQEVLYTHRCTDYSLRGQLLQEEFSFALGIQKNSFHA